MVSSILASSFLQSESFDRGLISVFGFGAEKRARTAVDLTLQLSYSQHTAAIPEYLMVVHLIRIIAHSGDLRNTCKSVSIGQIDTASFRHNYRARTREAVDVMLTV